MIDAACPTREALRRYLQGSFDPDDVDRLEQHLDQCPACEETVSSLEDTSDTLMRHLPLAAGGTAEDGPAPAWIERLKAGPPEDERQPEVVDEPVEDAWSDGLASYELLEVLGKGGMGVVYRGRHRQLGRPVAVKVVRPKLVSAAEAHRRFDREIQILGGLNHPGIVMATDAGRRGPAAYLVMELIDGVDLARLVRSAGPLDVGEACEVARQIAVALSAAHAAGAVHRDVKPSNVMIDRTGQVKLLDFGLAYLVELSGEHRETSLGRLIGTLDYMAPEQAEGGAVQKSADLYGLGATLFYLLAGRPPHASDPDRTLLAQLKALACEVPPRLADLRADVPQELSDLVAQLLAREPSERPETADEVADRLATWADTNAKATLIEMIPTARHCDDAEGAARSLVELIGDVPQNAEEKSSQHEKIAPAGGGRHVGRWLLGLAGFAAAAVLGIVLLVETPEGTLRIESEADNVEVELVDEADRTTTLRIEEGENATELRAGKYRIRLAGGHDNLRLTPDAIELRRGEVRLARIQQLPPEVTEKPAPGGDRLLYQGEAKSMWEERFHAETNPVAKIEAAKALVTMAGALEPEEEIQSILQIGAQLVDAGWGNDAKTVIAVGSNEQPTQWSEASFPDLDDLWSSFATLAANEARSVPREILAARLTSVAASAPPAKAMFAALLLRHQPMVAYIRQDQSATDTILRNLNRADDPALELPYLLIRKRYVDHASEPLQKAFHADFLRVGSELAEQPVTSATQAGVEAWVRAAADVVVAEELVARVLLALLLHDPAQTHRHFFAGGLRLYSEEAMQHFRGKVNSFADAWMVVACDWLEKNPEESEQAAAVISTFDIVLRVRTPSDEWPLEGLVELLAERVCRRYGPPMAEAADDEARPVVSTEDLLTYIVLAGGDLPECVRSPPRSGEIREQLEQLAELLSSEGEWTREDVRQLDRLGPLLRLAPYHCVKRLVEADGKTNLLFAYFRMKGQENSIDPLLLLAIATDFTGESTDQDARVATLFNDGNYGGIFNQSLHNALDSDFAVRQIAEKWLRRMHDRAESDDLKQRLVEMMPELATAKDDSQQADKADSESQIERPAAGGDRLLYQGEEKSVWEERFRAETNPVAKIEAAKALVTMAGALEPEEEIESILQIGAQLVDAGWGSRSFEVLLPQAYRLPPRWPTSTYPGIEQGWTTFVKLSANALAGLPSQLLATHLAKAGSQGTVPEATFAALMLRQSVASRIRDDQQAASTIVSEFKRDDPQAPALPFLLTRSFYSKSASPAARQAFQAEYREAGERLARQGVTDDNRQSVAAWVSSADYVGVTEPLVAKVLLALLFHDREETVQDFFARVPSAGRRWASDDLHTYPEGAMQQFRGAVPSFADAWMAVACDWLEEHPEESEQAAAVIGTFDIVLRVRTPSDEWPLERLVKLLSERVCQRYGSPDGEAAEDEEAPLVSTENLLAYIILAGGDLPECVRSAPRDGKIREQLEQLTELFSSEGRLTREGVRQLERLSPLLRLAPYHYTKSFIAVDRISVLPWVFSLLADRDRGIDPLLLLAIATDFTGESTEQDARIATLFSDTRLRRALYDPLNYAVASDFAVRQIAEKWLRRMHERAVSDDLKKRLEEIMPELAEKN